MPRKYYSTDATPLVHALQIAGYRARSFYRRGNPLDWDSKVRPKRTPGMCEALCVLAHEHRGTVWVWVEFPDEPADHEAVAQIAWLFCAGWSTIGYPREAA